MEYKKQLNHFRELKKFNPPISPKPLPKTECLGESREKIDRIDRNIICLLEKRMDVSKKLKGIKRRNNLPVKNIKREIEIINNLSKTSTLNKRFINKIFNQIFEESRRIQR